MMILLRVESKKIMSTRKYPLFVLIILLLASLACGSGARTAVPPQPDVPADSDPTAIPTADHSTRYEEAVNDLENPEPASPGVQALVGAPDIRSAEEQFVAFVASDVNQEWSTVFADSGYRYTAPGLIFIDSSGTVRSACQPGHTSKGPFYCSADHTIYFVKSELWDAGLHSSVEAVGDFATALIVAHEISHHVQNLLGISESVDVAEQELANDQGAVNALSALVELQADCLAGIWGYTAGMRGMMEYGDIEEGITILHHIGDDSLGVSNPGDYTHGSAQNRIEWFLVGYESGNLSLCNTFAAKGIPPQQPVPTEITPLPSYDAITRFFVNASSESCETVDDNVAGTIQTIRCTFEDQGYTVQVDYDEWSSEEAWINMLNEWSNSNALIAEKAWESTAANGHAGSYVIVRSQDDTSLLLWGVSGTRLTGTLYWYDQDDSAAENWFLQYGNYHNLP